MASVPAPFPAAPPVRARRAGRRSTPALGRWGLRSVAFAYLGVMVLLPLSAIVVEGYGEGLSALRGALASPGAWEAIRLTLFVAALTAVINAVFGTLLAYVLVRMRFPGRGLLATIVDLPFAIPTLVAGVMLLALYGPNAPTGGVLEAFGIRVAFAQLGILLAL